MDMGGSGETWIKGIWWWNDIGKFGCTYHGRWDVAQMSLHKVYYLRQGTSKTNEQRFGSNQSTCNKTR